MKVFGKIKVLYTLFGEQFSRLSKSKNFDQEFWFKESVLQKCLHTEIAAWPPREPRSFACPPRGPHHQLVSVFVHSEGLCFSDLISSSISGTAYLLVRCKDYMNKCLEYLIHSKCLANISNIPGKARMV